MRFLILFSLILSLIIYACVSFVASSTSRCCCAAYHVKHSFVGKDEEMQLPYWIYRVKKQDTLFRIANKFHVDMETLIKVNDIKALQSIPVGKPLIIISKRKTTHKKESKNQKVIPVLIPWEKAKMMLKPKKEYTIIDVATGLSFKVIHKYGSLHSDVEPATASDTKILKKIYGKWSWERRAVVAVIDGKAIAASMNGMPHGSQTIKNNNFPGMICIHFWGSAIHKTGKKDPQHHKMIKKASSTPIELPLN